MTCLEAQSHIMDFIDGVLPEEELREFIKHVKNCENCSEELEIYYTIIVGMRQVEADQNVTGDFKSQINALMDEKLAKLSAAKRVATSSILVALVAAFVCLVWIYGGILDKVYDHEQSFKLRHQSTYYYGDTFGDDLYTWQDAEASDISKLMAESEDALEEDSNLTFIANVKNYNLTHKNHMEILAEAEASDVEGELNEENTLN